ncbi:hypothetical protein GCM10012275_37030 [Longimycelium tulufanense]|uniref:Secreted protein n=1 Tax=Longimycelium tulufanense TaxID=907463 RepID=A0A8J3FXI6_9PSEU|nr:hypothetical protein [Longimycelium tulufanense]GGM62938.1 hypothetical protein GCM10012275_37030 [Longimycelium tulufanense]
MGHLARRAAVLAAAATAGLALTGAGTAVAAPTTPAQNVTVAAKSGGYHDPAHHHHHYHHLCYGGYGGHGGYHFSLLNLALNIGGLGHGYGGYGYDPCHFGGHGFGYR